MGNKVKKTISEQELHQTIKEGCFLNENPLQSYVFSEDVVEACIDAARFYHPFTLHSLLKNEVVEYLDKIRVVNTKFEIAKIDKTNTILVYLFLHISNSPDNITNLMKSRDDYLISVGTALSIRYSLPELIPPTNDEMLYKYFRSQEIGQKSLHLFQSPSFLSLAKRKMLQEERVIFIWMISNLISLIKNDTAEVIQDHKFLVALLKATDYPNKTHTTLFCLALQKHPNLVNEFVKIKLDIDPFTKQTNYTKWLQQVRMFNFIYDLRKSLPDTFESTEVFKFDEKRRQFFTLNQGDHALYSI